MTAPEMPAGRLPRVNLVLAVAQALRDPQRERRRLETVQDRLWREAPEDVAAAYDALTFGSLDFMEARGAEGAGRHGLHAERMRELRRPLPTRRRHGLTISDVAARSGMERETLARLLERHGYLEAVPYGGRQRRRMLTDEAFHAGIGHNADASRVRVGRVEGMHRAGVFPVLYPEHVPAVLWTLDYPGIVVAAAAITRKRPRLRWLLAHHGHLPDAEIAALAGYSLNGVAKARVSLTRVTTAASPSGAVAPSLPAQREPVTVAA